MGVCSGQIQRSNTRSATDATQEKMLVRNAANPHYLPIGCPVHQFLTYLLHFNKDCNQLVLITPGSPQHYWKYASFIYTLLASTSPWSMIHRSDFYYYLNHSISYQIICCYCFLILYIYLYIYAHFIFISSFNSNCPTIIILFLISFSSSSSDPDFLRTIATIN